MDIKYQVLPNGTAPEILGNKTVGFVDPATGRLLVDIGASVSITAGDIQIGAVELKSASTEDRAVIVAGTSVAEANVAVAVKDASLGLTTATESTSGNGSAIGILKNIRTRIAAVEASNALLLTDTQLRATAVPVSGTVTASGPVTDAQIRATPLPVSGTVAVTGVATETTLASALTSVQLLDDTVATSGSAIPAKGFAVSGTDGTNARVIKVSTAGQVYSNLRNDAGTEIGTTTTPVVVTLQPAAATASAASMAKSTAYATSLVAKASAGIFFAVVGYNSKTSAQFIQVHNTTSLPADTAVPICTFTAAASSNFIFDLSPFGAAFSTGITVCNSSTGATKTVGSADCWFNVLYV